MDVIPVIDVREGIAVKAIAGNRSQYLPLDSPLAKGCKPEDVACAYYGLFPFKTLYVADLDGIEHGQPNPSMQKKILEVWQGANVWIDDGTFENTKKKDRLFSVIGSETLLMAGLCQIKNLKDTIKSSSILSLDFRGDTFLGPPFLLQETQLWPERIIVMCLERVGCKVGPDFKKIEWIKMKAGVDKKIYAAGSIRDCHDLFALKNCGVAGALIATALHSGQIKIGDLMKIAD